MATHLTDNRSEDTRCRCGADGNLDPMIHFERYGHWPALPDGYYGTAAEETGKPPAATVSELTGRRYRPVVNGWG